MARVENCQWDWGDSGRWLPLRISSCSMLLLFGRITENDLDMSEHPNVTVVDCYRS